MESLTWPGVFVRAGDYVLFGGCGAGWDLWDGQPLDRDANPGQVPADDAVYMVGDVKVAELAETEEDEQQVNYVAIDPIDTEYGEVRWALVGDHPIWAATDEETAACKRYEADLNAPSAPLPTATTAVTMTPTATPSPADVRITDFTLSDEQWVSDFMALQEPIASRASGLWVKLTNIGGMPYLAPAGGGQYTLQVILNQAGGKLEDYTFAPGDPPELEPLPNLQPGTSFVLRVEQLFLWTPADRAQLHVLFRPDPAPGLRDSMVSRPLSVREHPDPGCACAAGVARHVLGALASEWGAAAPDAPAWVPNAAELGTLLEQQGCRYPQKTVMDTARWLVDQTVDLAGGEMEAEELGRVLSMALDIAAEAQSEGMSCLSVADWTVAVTHALIARGLPVGAVIAESPEADWPAFPLVVDSSGRRSGFSEDGQALLEIPGSRAALLGGTCAILYPGREPVQIHVVGRAAGALALDAILAQSDGSALSLSYRSVRVEAGTAARLDSGDRDYTLHVDLYGDGRALETVAPNPVRRMTRGGAVLALPSPTPVGTLVPVFVATATRAPTAAPTPSRSAMGRLGAFRGPIVYLAPLGLLAALAAALTIRARRGAKSARPPGEGKEPPA